MSPATGSAACAASGSGGDEIGRHAFAAVGLAFSIALVSLAGAGAAAREPAAMESVDQAVCRLIETAAAANRLPVDFFTRLIWRESNFLAGVTSPAGAQGIAQFMPETAAAQGLADPFDLEQAVPKAARLLAELRQRFGNLGLAAAAYNGGPGRVANWLQGRGELPAETRAYVLAVTQRSAEEWAAASKERVDANEPAPAQSCQALTAVLRRSGPDSTVATSPLAPWGVQLAGNFSKALALAQYGRARQQYSSVIGAIRPMIIATRLRSRGTRTFYLVRLPSPTRTTADALCERIRALGGACAVLRS